MTNPPTRRPLQLTREQVLAKYGPVPNTYRTPEALEAFLAALPKPCTRSPDVVKAGEARAMLVRDYGGATLKAQRMGGLTCLRWAPFWGCLRRPIATEGNT